MGSVFCVLGLGIELHACFSFLAFLFGFYNI